MSTQTLPQVKNIVKNSPSFLNSHQVVSINPYTCELGYSYQVLRAKNYSETDIICNLDNEYLALGGVETSRTVEIINSLSYTQQLREEADREIEETGCLRIQQEEVNLDKLIAVITYHLPCNTKIDVAKDKVDYIVFRFSNTSHGLRTIKFIPDGNDWQVTVSPIYFNVYDGGESKTIGLYDVWEWIRFFIPTMFPQSEKDLANKETKEILDWLECETDNAILFYSSQNIRTLKDDFLTLMFDNISYNSISDTMQSLLRFTLEDRVDWQLVIKYVESRKEDNAEHVATKKQESEFIRWVKSEFEEIGNYYFLSLNPNDFLQYDIPLLLSTFNTLNSSKVQHSDRLVSEIVESHIYF